MALLDRLLAKEGKTRADVRKNSRVGKLIAREGVPASKELDRILLLPRERWEEQAEPTVLTEALRQPEGEQTLRPVQAAALQNLHDCRGLLAPITVGGGKTLISMLAPVVLEAHRPILLVPAKLRDKTHREFAEASKHWRHHPDVPVVSYELLGRVNGAKILESRKPDLIIADECHRLKNPKAACTRRVARWMVDHPETVFAGMSGTITKRSLLDFWHLVRWALGDEHAPLPRKRKEIELWGRALDVKVTDLTRMDLGALTIFGPTRADARRGLGQRIEQTPGVVSIAAADDLDASIVMETWDPDLPEEVEREIEAVREKRETKGGDTLVGRAEVWRHTRELVCGFYYEWDPEPPKEWLVARRAWKFFVRAILENSTYDSELQVANAIRAGKLQSDGSFERWAAVRERYRIKPSPVWLSTDVLQQACRRIQGPTLVWVEHVAVGEKLAELTGHAFFHHGGVDTHGTPIESLAGKHSAIVSIQSNAEGRNLQAWSRNLVITPPAMGATWEQLLGRTHRPGQREDEVSVAVMLGHPTLHESLAQAKADARYIEQVSGTPQKLLLAT